MRTTTEGLTSAMPDTAIPSPELLEEFSCFFRLLSEPARLQLLCRLKQGPMDVAALMQATGFSQSHISRQLGQLQRAGLVCCERDGVRTIWSGWRMNGNGQRIGNGVIDCNILQLERSNFFSCSFFYFMSNGSNSMFFKFRFNKSKS